MFDQELPYASDWVAWAIATPCAILAGAAVFGLVVWVHKRRG